VVVAGRISAGWADQAGDRGAGAGGDARHRVHHRADPGGLLGHDHPLQPCCAGRAAGDDLLSKLPETIGVFVVSGSEDFLIHVAVRDNQDLYAFVIDRLTERPQIADVRTSAVYEHLHKTQITPNA